jgi:hypothetical protein
MNKTIAIIGTVRRKMFACFFGQGVCLPRSYAGGAGQPVTMFAFNIICFKSVYYKVSG